MLEAKNIHKSFGSNKVLRGVDVTITPGKLTCLIGPSGCGKTTLLRALSFLEAPEQGSIIFQGQQYNYPLKGDVLPPWPRITTVFQSLFLWPHLTLRENIMLPARSRNPQAEEDIKSLIQFFEMKTFIDHYPNEASVGQRQRVALARALILNPEYILMDEITSALDVEQTAKILEKLAQLKERNIGLFLITHQLGFTKKAADSVIFMDGGKVVEKGEASILKKPSSKRMQQFLDVAALS